MDLTELYKKHDQDIKTFNTLRDKTWADMQERHKHIIAAFGSKENLPDDARKNIDNEVNEFIRHWSTDTGLKYRAIKKQHQEQVKAITSKPKQPANANKKSVQEAQATQTDRDKSKQQMIAQQKAMTAKINKRQKPKR